MNHKLRWIVGVLLLCIAVCFTQPASDSGEIGGYLFAHMTTQDYGRLYYSLSRDGLLWQNLNEGKRVHEAYRGHPDITYGHDGRYYLVGNTGGSTTPIAIWVSDDLSDWQKHAEHHPDLSRISDFTASEEYFGAPKMFYHADEDQYIITWHTTNWGEEKNFKTYWGGMRTLYATTKDFKTYTDPKRLFSYDIATIDVIIRREDDTYFAIIKDEKYPDFDWPTGKAIRIAKADHPLGPYSEPSDKISSSFREAPTLISAPNGEGYYLYYEKYPGLAYEMSTAPSLNGPWIDFYSPKFIIPEGARHGCMIEIRKKEFEVISQKYGPFVEPERPDAE